MIRHEIFLNISINYTGLASFLAEQKRGADGVLIESTGSQTSTVIGGYGTGYLYSIPVTAKSVTGKAIYVNQ